VGSRASQEVVVKRKISTLPGIELRLSSTPEEFATVQLAQDSVIFELGIASLNTVNLTNQPTPWSRVLLRSL
jgi:hypothetical protein